MSLDVMLGLVHSGELSIEPLRGKVESNSSYGKETKASDLNAHAGKTEIFAQINLVLCVRVGRVGS